MDEIPNVKSYFTELLDLSFRIKNAFVQEFEEVKGESENLHGSVDTERMNSEKERETFLLREQEIYHQPENCQWRLQKTGKVCLNELLSTLFNLQKIELQKLVVVTDTMNVITSQEEGLALDLSSILIDKSEKGDCYFRHSHATVVIVYNDGCTITLDLKDEGLAGNSFYFRITACKSPKSIDRETTLNGGDNEADTRSVLVAYDSSSMEDKRAELKYMWQDAIDKVEEGKESELTDEQRLICNCTIADAAYNMYWGKKLSLNKRYFEALPHWENAFYALQGSFDDLTDSRKDDFYEVCYWAGFCHTELKQYQRAYYFLDILFSLNRVRYTEEYINALANSGDFRALNIIDNLLEHIDIGDVTDEKESRMLDFINFLRRRKGFVLVDLGKLDEAEKLFTSMLEESDNNDYALQELAYIRSLRKKDMGGN